MIAAGFILVHMIRLTRTASYLSPSSITIIVIIDVVIIVVSGMGEDSITELCNSDAGEAWRTMFSYQPG